jgi:AMP phosphorylase
MKKQKVYFQEETLDAINAIRKKLVGKTLTYKEIYSIMDQIARKRLSDILTTYFAASAYSKGFTNQELYYLTKAMVETGRQIHFEGIVADKHSIGGVPGTRTTLVVVPIVAAAGFVIPKSSSRAITTPGSTADAMEVLAPVNLSKEKILNVVKKTNGCIVWGGSFGIAPADDIIIKVERPLLLESYDKILVSIMAKKVAFGSNHVVIDLPYGATVKVHGLNDAKVLKEKFEYLAKKFNIKIRVLVHRTNEPGGRGIGPILEAREAIRVLQQKSNRPADLEIRSINLAGNLLDICLKDSPRQLQDFVKKNYGNSFGWATKMLQKGIAFAKMQEIIKEQGGNPNIDSENLKPGQYFFKLKSLKTGSIKSLNNKNMTIIAKILGAPKQKGSGIFLDKKIGEAVEKGNIVATLYSESAHNL